MFSLYPGSPYPLPSPAARRSRLHPCRRSPLSNPSIHVELLVGAVLPLPSRAVLPRRPKPPSFSAAALARRLRRTRGCGGLQRPWSTSTSARWRSCPSSRMLWRTRIPPLSPRTHGSLLRPPRSMSWAGFSQPSPQRGAARPLSSTSNASSSAPSDARYQLLHFRHAPTIYSICFPYCPVSRQTLQFLCFAHEGHVQGAQVCSCKSIRSVTTLRSCLCICLGAV